MVTWHALPSRGFKRTMRRRSWGRGVSWETFVNSGILIPYLLSLSPQVYRAIALLFPFRPRPACELRASLAVQVRHGESICIATT